MPINLRWRNIQNAIAVNWRLSLSIFHIVSPPFFFILKNRETQQFESPLDMSVLACEMKISVRGYYG